MKRIFLFAFCSAFFFATAKAQMPPTLSDSGYVLIGQDTVLTPNGSLLPFRTLGQPDTNASWDLSLATANGLLGVQERLSPPATGNPFPNADFTYRNGSVLNPLLALLGMKYIHGDSTGFFELGISNEQESAHDISSFTHSAGDSLFFPPQADTFSQAIAVFRFPASFSSSWQTTGSRRSIRFEVTANAFGLTRAAGVWHYDLDIADSIVGWGQMRVAVAPNGTSTYMPVLQVRRKMLRRDSFLINGVEPPAGFLTALGLTQGKISNYYFTRFYQPAEWTPLAEAQHADSTYTNLLSLLIRRSGIEPSGVSEIEQAYNWKIFPNPVQGSVINLEMPGNTGSDWRFKLFNIAGQMLEQGNMQFSASLNRGQIFLSAKSLAMPGFYTLRIESKAGSCSFIVVRN